MIARLSEEERLDLIEVLMERESATRAGDYQAPAQLWRRPTMFEPAKLLLQAKTPQALYDLIPRELHPYGTHLVERIELDGLRRMGVIVNMRGDLVAVYKKS